MIQREVFSSGAAVGSAGSATATAHTLSMLSGIVYSVHVTYGDAPPAGTSVVIEGVNTPKQEVLTISGNSDGWHHVMHPASSSADGGSISNQGTLVAIHDKVQVTISSCNAGDSVSVCMLYEVIK